MPDPEHLLIDLCDLRPELHPEAVCYCTVAHSTDVASTPWLGLFREDEALTVIVPEVAAIERGWPVLFRAAWITLQVDSQLHDVGLTAAVSTALATAGISCNVVAAAHHDHVFVPFEQGAAAAAVLYRLRDDACRNIGRTNR